MTEEEALLAEIRASPDDDLVRLVYCDYLEEENRDPGRALFIRAGIEMYKRDPDYSYGYGSPSGPPDSLERILLDNANRGLYAPLMHAMPVGVDYFYMAQNCVRAVRGFPALVRCPLATWYGVPELGEEGGEEWQPYHNAAAAGPSLAVFPLQRVELTDRRPREHATPFRTLHWWAQAHADMSPSSWADDGMIPEPLWTKEMTRVNGQYFSLQAALDAVSEGAIAWARRKGGFA